MQVILTCGAKKATTPCPAWRMYRGTYFGAALGWAQSVAKIEDVYILSAKYGLIPCAQRIEPYEAQMGTPTQIITAEEIVKQAETLGLAKAKPIFVGGSAYRAALSQAIPGAFYLTDYMREGQKQMGHQISWLTRNHGTVPAAIHAGLKGKR